VLECVCVSSLSTLCREVFHVLMALCSTVFPRVCSGLGDCEETPGGKSCGECMSQLCFSCLNRQFGAFNRLIPLTKTTSDEVLYFEPGEIDMHVIEISPLCTLLCSGPNVICLCPSYWHLAI
jgi:hypothetical protein